MSDRAALRRMRTLIRTLAAISFVATILELLMAEHTESAMQLVPVALCGLGLAALTASWLTPTRPVVLATRAAMVIVAAGSLLGVYEHMMGNLEFVREVRAHADTMTLVTETLHGGAPILAPGMLALAAALTIAGTIATAPAPDTTATPPIVDEPLTRAEATDWLHARFPKRQRWG